MWDFFKRWHPLIILLAGIYLAIPKPAPNPAEVDEEYLAEYDENGDGVIDRDEFEGGDLAFDARDENGDNALTVGSFLKWPMHQYKWNLGQDLKGGTSLRYVLRQQDMEDAEEAIANNVLSPLEGQADNVPAEVWETFGPVVEGEPLELNMWSEEDFELLHDVPALFNEDRIEALKRHWQTWNNAAKQRADEDLVGPTIETLNRRLNATGITELNIAALGSDRLEVKLPEFSTRAQTERYKELLETTGKLEMRVLASEESEFADLDVGEFPPGNEFTHRWLPVENEVQSALAKEKDGETFVPVQVVDEWNITGRSLGNIQPGTDQRGGGLAVTFDLKGLAVAHFEELSTRHKVRDAGGEDPRLLAIVIDDRVYSAYNIQDTITGSVQLSGRFNSQERDDLINVLKSGSLNVKLDLEGEETVGPSEGAESVQRGLWSLLIGALGVFIVALIVYRGLGLLTVFNLITVVVLVMGAMAAGLGTLTMPGIAGIVLTIGMAIDANILINERIREERERNTNTRGAVEEGFKNALSAIVDANVTTLLTALILFKVGSGPIQGFALTLAIGIIATLYTSLASYKAMVTGILNVKRDVNLRMAGLNFVRNRNINWLRWMAPGAAVAFVLIVTGGSFIVTHGAEILGIEFRGGHTFRVQLDDAYERPEIADLLIDESTGDARFEWAEDIEIQPVGRLGADFEAGHADRFDFRFPMRSEWRNDDPEDITNLLRGHLSEALSDYMVKEGWRARSEDVTGVTFRARLEYRLKNPAQFRELYPDSYDELWLARERAWRAGADTPSENQAQWFGDIGAESVDWELDRNAAGDRQFYTLTLSGIAVTDEDVEDKQSLFREAVAQHFYENTEFVELDGDPEFQYMPTEATLVVDLVLLEPVNVSDFQEAVGRLTEGPLANIALEAEPQNADAEEASEFRIRSLSPVQFSTDPEDENHFTRLDGTLNEEINDWVVSNPPEGNEISQRFLLSSAVGATVAAESQWRALFAIIAALVIVVIYIRIRFASVAWGLAAVAALLHDSFVVVGLIGLFDYFGADIKIDLTVVAAILTVIGYSLNDTIINFDRIRENLKRDRLATGGKTPLKQIVNESINQMLPRTFMTSGTTLLTTIAMLLLGGPLLKGFAFAMTMGIIVGTFSSIYIAGPILLFFDRKSEGGLLDLTEEEAEEVRAEVKTEAEANKAEGTDSDEDAPDDKQS